MMPDPSAHGLGINAYRAWAAEILRGWAETFEEDEEGNEPRKDIWNLAGRIERGRASLEDHQEALFHIWQAAHEWHEEQVTQ